MLFSLHSFVSGHWVHKETLITVTVSSGASTLTLWWGGQSFRSYASSVSTWLSGAPGPASDLACDHVLPDGPWTINNPTSITTLLCSPASSAVGPLPTGGITAQLGVPSVPSSPSLREQCHLCCSVMFCFRVLKMQVHFRKVTLSRNSCCWLAFIKQHLYLHFRGNLATVFSKTGVTCSTHLSQSSLLQPSSTVVIKGAVTRQGYTSLYLHCCLRGLLPSSAIQSCSFSSHHHLMKDKLIKSMNTSWVSSELM